MKSLWYPSFRKIHRYTFLSEMCPDVDILKEALTLVLVTFGLDAKDGDHHDDDDDRGRG